MREILSTIEMFPIVHGQSILNQSSEHFLKKNSTIFKINISFNDKNLQQYSPIRTTFDNFII